MANGNTLALTGIVIDKFRVPDKSSQESPPPEFSVIKVYLGHSTEEEEYIEIKVSSKIFDQLWKGSHVRIDYDQLEQNFVFIS